MDNATTGIVTQGIRHGFWVNDLGPPVNWRPSALRHLTPAKDCSHHPRATRQREVSPIRVHDARAWSKRSMVSLKLQHAAPAGAPASGVLDAQYARRTPCGLRPRTQPPPVGGDVTWRDVPETGGAAPLPCRITGQAGAENGGKQSRAMR